MAFLITLSSLGKARLRNLLTFAAQGWRLKDPFSWGQGFIHPSLGTWPGGSSKAYKAGVENSEPKTKGFTSSHSWESSLNHYTSFPRSQLEKFRSHWENQIKWTINNHCTNVWTQVRARLHLLPLLVMNIHLPNCPPPIHPSTYPSPFSYSSTQTPIYLSTYPSPFSSYLPTHLSPILPSSIYPPSQSNEVSTLSKQKINISGQQPSLTPSTITAPTKQAILILV